MNALERDALQVLGLVRSLRNSLAPINRIPPEVLSLIPDYYEDDGEDQDLIALTHVCHGWRDIFTSRSSLWTQLAFPNIDSTRTYIQRSKSSPLEIWLDDSQDETYLEASSLIIPHIHRLKHLSISGDTLPGILSHFHCQLPLLEWLDIHIIGPRDQTLDDALFGGNLSSLRQLHLHGVITHLPWKNMANLDVVDLRSCRPGYGVTQLLDFFESAPRLHTVRLGGSIPNSSDAPPDRTVALRHLGTFTIRANPPYSVLLNHLHIPTGTMMVLGFCFRGGRYPLLDCLPKVSTNLSNLSHITTINLLFDSTEKFARLVGPSGCFLVNAHWEGRATNSYFIDRQILQTFGPPILSTALRLAISQYRRSISPGAEDCPVFRTLSNTSNLQTLVLNECNNLPFILALNPQENPSKLTLCPKLIELVLYIKRRDRFHLKHLLSMAEHRASEGAKLLSITFIGLGGFVPGDEVLKLKENVTDVVCLVDGAPPAWDNLPPESAGESG